MGMTGNRNSRSPLKHDNLGNNNNQIGNNNLIRAVQKLLNYGWGGCLNGTILGVGGLNDYIITDNFLRKKKAQQNDSLTFYTEQISIPNLLMRSSRNKSQLSTYLKKTGRRKEALFSER